MKIYWILLLGCLSLNLYADDPNDWMDPVVGPDEPIVDPYDLSSFWEDPYKDFENPQEKVILKILGYYGKLKIFDEAIDSAVDKVNKDIIRATTDRLFFADLREKIKNKLRYTIREGATGSLPLSVWVQPLLNTQIVATREMDLDKYSGSEKKIHLIDQVGINFKIGAQIGFSGLSDLYFLENQMFTHFHRTYRHIRPMKSINELIRFPFNSSVPLDTGELFQKPIFFRRGAIDFNSSHLDRSELDGFYEGLKKKLKVGESLIITDSFGRGINIRPGVRVRKELIEAYGYFRKGRVITSRVQIYRKSKNEFDVYKDRGGSKYYNLGHRVQLLLPVYSYNRNVLTGKATIRYFNLRYLASEDRPKQSKLRKDEHYKNILALQYLIHTGSITGFKSKVKPYTIEHDFNDSIKSQNAFSLFRRKLSRSGTITIKKPNGYKDSFYVSQFKSANGNDKYTYSVDALDSIISGILSTGDTSEAPLNDYSSPLYGKEKTISINIESEIKKNPKKRTQSIADSHVTITQTWRGWELSRKKAQRIFKVINNRYKKDFNLSQFSYPMKLYSINMRHRLSLKELFKVIQSKESFTNSPFKEDFHLSILKRRLQKSGYQVMRERLEKNLKDLFSHKSADELASIFNEASVAPEVTLKGYNPSSRDEEAVVNYQVFQSIKGQEKSKIETLKEELGILDREFNAHWIRPYL